MSGGDTSDPLTAAAATAFKGPFGAILQLHPLEGAALWVDGRGSEIKISDSAPSDGADACTWTGHRDNLLRGLSGERAFEKLFVSGGIAVAGDMSVMMRLELSGAK